MEQVSEELIRVAILWHELWHEGLEEASRLYFGERNVTGMFNVLEPLHAMLERGPQTLKETSFHQVLRIHQESIRNSSDLLEHPDSFAINLALILHKSLQIPFQSKSSKNPSKKTRLDSDGRSNRRVNKQG